MSHTDDIAVIRTNNKLSNDEKRSHIYALKCNAIIASLHTANLIGKTFKAENGLEITITQAPNYDPVTERLTIWVSATRNGVEIVFPERALPFVYVNPPLIHNGVESPLAAIKQIISDTVAMF